MRKCHHPGESTPRSGQYKEYDPQSGRLSETEITAVEGKPLPPTHQPGHAWVLVDATKHKV